MLKRHSQFLQSLLFIFDLTVICICWIMAYHIRFQEGLAPVEKGIPSLEVYLWVLLPIVFVWGLSFRAFNLYRPRRMGTHLAEFLDLAKANTLSVLILVALTFLHPSIRILSPRVPLLLDTEPRGPGVFSHGVS